MKLLTTLFVSGLVVALSIFSMGCKESVTGPGGSGGGGFAVSPNPVNVQVGQQATATVSGGRQPYSVRTGPNVSIATASLTGATLTVTGVAVGTTFVVLQDSGGVDSVRVNINVTTAGGGGGYGSGTITSTSATQGNLSFTGQGIWPAGAGPSVIAVYDTVVGGLQVLGYQQVSGGNYDFILMQFLAPGGVSVQTYPIGENTAQILIAANVDTNQADSMAFSSISGSINVTSVSGSTVQGTYSISAIRLATNTTASFTGTFNVTYVRGRAVVETGGGGGGGGGTASFTLNGAGFNNAVFNLGSAYAAYFSSNNSTGVSAMAVQGSDTTWLFLNLPGNTTGTFQFSGGAAVFISHGGGQNVREFFSSPSGGGNITVTSYGNVGGNVTGTFSGTLYEFTQSGMDSVSLTNGSFVAERVQ